MDRTLQEYSIKLNYKKAKLLVRRKTTTPSRQMRINNKNIGEVETFATSEAKLQMMEEVASK